MDCGTFASELHRSSFWEAASGEVVRSPRSSPPNAITKEHAIDHRGSPESCRHTDAVPGELLPHHRHKTHDTTLGSPAAWTSTVRLAGYCEQ